MIQRKYGWKRSLPDFRDQRLSAPLPSTVHNLPPVVDMRPNVPEIYNQGQTSSCTSHSTVAHNRLLNIKQGLPDIPPSRLFHYWLERYTEGTLSEDGGAQVRTAVKVLGNYGICPESEFPFDESKLYTKPADNLFKDAVQDMAHIYFAIDQRLDDFKNCLAEGFPFVLGFTVYDSFESEEVAKTGIMPFPKDNENSVGGHAVCCVGYDDTTKTFTIQNSWGADWGDKGFFHMPYSYLTNPDLASDFWTVRTMENLDPNRKWIVPK